MGGDLVVVIAVTNRPNVFDAVLGRDIPPGQRASVRRELKRPAAAPRGLDDRAEGPSIEEERVADT